MFIGSYGRSLIEHSAQINEGQELYMAALRQLSEEYPTAPPIPSVSPSVLSSNTERSDCTNSITNPLPIPQSCKLPIRASQFGDRSSYCPFGSSMFSGEAMNSVRNDLCDVTTNINNSQKPVVGPIQAPRNNEKPGNPGVASQIQPPVISPSTVIPELSRKPSYVDIAKKNASTGTSKVTIFHRNCETGLSKQTTHDNAKETKKSSKTKYPKLFDQVSR